MCCSDEADRKIAGNIPSNTYTDGCTAGKVHSLCADDAYNPVKVHYSYLERVDELCDRKRHRLLCLYMWCKHEGHKAECLCVSEVSLDTWVQLPSSCEFRVPRVRKTVNMLTRELQKSKENIIDENLDV